MDIWIIPGKVKTSRVLRDDLAVKGVTGETSTIRVRDGLGSSKFSCTDFGDVSSVGTLRLTISSHSMEMSELHSFLDWILPSTSSEASMFIEGV